VSSQSVKEHTANFTGRPNEWNNSWTGLCDFSVQRDIDLEAFPTNSTDFQQEVPGLGFVLPAWTILAESPDHQGARYVGFYDNAAQNGTGRYKDRAIFYVFNNAFGSTSSEGTQITSVQLCLGE
jgi:hypothetical protein